MNYKVKLDFFEGPLDLLLHLIKKNQVNIYDIPMALITRQYLEYIEMMRELNLEIAGEFLLMASTLIHIKSKMLLPSDKDDNGEIEDEDPRSNLVVRLLEYKRFKEAGMELEKREELWRNIFYRKPNLDTEEEIVIEAGLFDLIEAFKDMIRKIPEKIAIDILPEELTVRGRMGSIIDKLDEAGPGGVTLYDLVEENFTKRFIIVTFLAILELTRLRIIRLIQAGENSTLRIIKSINTRKGDMPRDG